jgi:hypothetical protein
MRTRLLERGYRVQDFAITRLAHARCTTRTRARRQSPRLTRPSVAVARDSHADSSPPGAGGADKFAYRLDRKLQAGGDHGGGRFVYNDPAVRLE